MTEIRHFFYCLSLLSMLTACGSSEDVGSVTPPDEPEKDEAKVGLALSVSNNTVQQTRSSADIIQQTGRPFRGLTDLRFAAFQVQREVQSGDTPYPATVSEVDPQDGKNAKFFFYKDVELLIGSCSMLVYAKATGITNKTEKAQNGSTQAVYPANLAPSGITFSPEHIYSGTTTHTAATAIATYLTTIANTEGWAEDHELRQNFIGKGVIAPSLNCRFVSQCKCIRRQIERRGNK